MIQDNTSITNYGLLHLMLNDSSEDNDAITQGFSSQDALSEASSEDLDSLYTSSEDEKTKVVARKFSKFFGISHFGVLDLDVRPVEDMRKLRNKAARILKVSPELYSTESIEDMSNLITGVREKTQKASLMKVWQRLVLEINSAKLIPFFDTIDEVTATAIEKATYEATQSRQVLTESEIDQVALLASFSCRQELEAQFNVEILLYSLEEMSLEELDSAFSQWLDKYPEEVHEIERLSLSGLNLEAFPKGLFEPPTTKVKGFRMSD